MINTPSGNVDAIAPLIISASRSTDIPAFHAKWFMHRLKEGYVKWINPFNQKPQYISFQNTRAIVFWSKNPAPLLPFLFELDELRIPYYFQFTLNDYDAERFEPNVPSLEARIETFQKLAERIGQQRVIWRFDPLILAAGLEPDDLIAKIVKIGDQVHKHTSKLIFSFADIASYAKVPKNLNAAGISFREFTPTEMLAMGQMIGLICQQWGIMPVTCGEEIDLTAYGVEKNRCIDDELLLDISSNDPALVDLFGYSLNLQMNFFGTCEQPKRKDIKDPGQRKECGCVFSKDIGQYNTCMHLCVYCYANTSPSTVKRNVNNCGVDSESIVYREADKG
jgi:hypothetical protein